MSLIGRLSIFQSVCHQSLGFAGPKHHIIQAAHFHVSRHCLRNKNHYEVLGVSKNASDKEIKTAYFNMAKKYHPDANPGDPNSAKKFQEVSEAYSVLSNAESRKNYDYFGNTSTYQGNPFASQRGHTQYHNTNYQYYYRNQVSPEEAEKMFADILKEFEKISRQPNFGMMSNTKYAQKHPIKSAILNRILSYIIGALFKKVISSIEKKQIRRK